MKQEAFDAVISLVNWIWQLLNSNFLVALAGAFAGAFGAYWIVERHQRKRGLLKEIRSTNAAIIVAHGISNASCSLKSQFVKEFKDRFFEQHKAALEAFQRKKHPMQPFEFQADFQTFPPIRVPIDVLQKLLFENISVADRSLTLVTTLSQAIDGLNATIKQRNELIATIKEASPPVPHDVLASIYFGFPDKNGNIDHRYRDCVEGISSQTDDCIFFSKLLSEDLHRHGKKLSASLGKNSPSINKVDFTKAEQKGLIPDTGHYADWMSMFKSSSKNE